MAGCPHMQGKVGLQLVWTVILMESGILPFKSVADFYIIWYVTNYISYFEEKTKSLGKLVLLLTFFVLKAECKNLKWKTGIIIDKLFPQWSVIMWTYKTGQVF